jgi:hypothetical protein
MFRYYQPMLLSLWQAKATATLKLTSVWRDAEHSESQHHSAGPPPDWSTVRKTNHALLHVSQIATLHYIPLHHRHASDRTILATFSNTPPPTTPDPITNHANRTFGARTSSAASGHADQSSTYSCAVRPHTCLQDLSYLQD